MMRSQKCIVRLRHQILDPNLKRIWVLNRSNNPKILAFWDFFISFDRTEIKKQTVLVLTASNFKWTCRFKRENMQNTFSEPRKPCCTLNCFILWRSRDFSTFPPFELSKFEISKFWTTQRFNFWVSSTYVGGCHVTRIYWSLNPYEKPSVQAPLLLATWTKEMGVMWPDHVMDKKVLS